MGIRIPREGTIGAGYGELVDIAWDCDNALGAIHEVGREEPNPWGFHDMLGNVWERCWDAYDREVYGSYRVLRGGGWNDEASPRLQFETWRCRTCSPKTRTQAPSINPRVVARIRPSTKSEALHTGQPASPNPRQTTT